MSFLRDLIPDTGETCLARLRHDGRFAHSWVDLWDDQAVLDAAVPWLKEGHDVYFAMASFTKKKRRQDNVDRVKCLWLDIDAGERKYAKHGDKVYKTAKDALKDFQDWMTWGAVPAPTYIVSSGHGWHVYWGLTESVDVATWRRLNAGLISLAKEGDLRIDAGATKNYAGVLRVPGTVHQRSGKTVKAIYSGDLLTVDTLMAALPVPAPEPTSVLGAKPAHLQNITPEKTPDWDSFGSSFGRILNRSKTYDPDDKRTGCEQLWLIATDQDRTEEPLWRAGLSITENCDDPGRWGHLISSAYHNYSPDETDEKRAPLAGKPYTCSAFDDLNPGVCKHCPHQGKITSPIQLGRYVKTEDSYDDLKDNAPEKPEPDLGDEAPFDAEAVWESIDPLDWKPPFPYARKKGGGIVRKSQEGEDAVVFDYDLVCTDRTYSAEHGEVLCFDVYLPNDAKRSFQLPMSLLSSDDKLIAEVARYGVIAVTKADKILMGNFLRACAKNLVADVAANETVDAMGWTPDTTAFVLGTTRYEKGARRRAAVSDAALPLSESTDLRGTYDRFTDWADNVAMYNHKGMEPAQFLLAASLAGPLYRLQGENGPTLHVYSHETGLGKTAATRVALSIWGRPKRSGHKLGLESTAKDTENSLRTRLTMHNSIPMSIDEVTDLDDQRLRSLIYEFTQGTEKQRATANGGLSALGGTWDTCMFTTGNKSLFDRLGADSNREALFARFIEVDFSANKSLREHYTVRQIDDNLQSIYQDCFGVAGHIFATWMTANQEEVGRIMTSVTEYLDSKIEFAQGERYWRAAMVCTLTAARIGHDLGMWDWTAKSLVPYVRKLITSHRRDTEELSEVQDETLGGYFLQCQDALVTTDAQGRILDSKIPRQRVAIRIDNRTREVAIVKYDLDQWAKSTGRNLRELHKYLRSRGAEEARVEMLAGADSREAVAAKAACWVLPISALDGGI